MLDAHDVRAGASSSACRVNSIVGTRMGVNCLAKVALPSVLAPPARVSVLFSGGERREKSGSWSGGGVEVAICFFGVRAQDERVRYICDKGGRSSEVSAEYS